MYAGAFDCGREPRERMRREREMMFKHQRLTGLRGRQEGERNLRRVAFLAPQTRPERSIYDHFDCLRVGRGR